MGILNMALWVGGVALVAFGWTRFRGPWARYQALKEEDANVARYNAWRGGVRDDGTTGASVAMEVFRRQMTIWGAVIVFGVVLVVLGFVVR
jgi:hypothetical protein